MFSLLRASVFLFLLLPGVLIAQGKAVKGIDENATLDQTRTWLLDALPKYASTKTRTSATNLTDVKFDGCNLSFTIVRKVGSSSEAVMGTTRTVNSMKQEHSLALADIEAGGIQVTPSLYPEFETLSISWEPAGQDDTRVIELTVKSVAAGAIRFALDRARALCTQPK